MGNLFVTQIFAAVGSNSARRRLVFLQRKKIDCEPWLKTTLRSADWSDATLCLKLLSRSFGIDVEKFRAEDSMSTIAETDFLGDNDLEIGWLMRSQGVQSVAEDCDIVTWLRLLVPLQSHVRTRLIHMLGDA